MAKTIADYQADYNRKGATQAEKDAAHSGAESIRAKSGYSGGADGSQKIAINKSVKINSSNGKSKTIKKDSDKLSEVEKSQYYGVQDWAKDGKQYAYKDSYGFEHVGDLAQAMAYGGGKAYEYTGAAKGGYARDANGNRARIGQAGSVEYGNAKKDANGNIISYKAAGTLGAGMDLDTAYRNYKAKQLAPTPSASGGNDIAYWQNAFKSATTEADKVKANQEANKIRAASGQELQYYQPQYGGGDMAQEQIPASAPVSATASAPADMADGYDSIQERQDYLLKQKKRVEVDRLRNQLRQAENEFDSQENKIAPKFLQQKTNLNVSSQLQRRSFDEFLASRNMLNSGSAAQGEIARNIATQQGLTDIGTAESNAYADIADRRTQANLAYDYGVTNAENDLATQQAQAEINALLQQQSAYESAQAKQAEYEWEMQKSEQEQANKLAIEQIKIAAAQAKADNDFAREKELLTYKNQLEKEQIKLRASTSRSSGGGSSSGGATATASNLNVTQRALAKSVQDQIAQSPGAYRTILSRVTDPAVSAYLSMIYGSPSVSGVAASPTEWNFAKAYSKSQGVTGY